MGKYPDSTGRMSICQWISNELERKCGIMQVERRERSGMIAGFGEEDKLGSFLLIY